MPVPVYPVSRSVPPPQVRHEIREELRTEIIPRHEVRRNVTPDIHIRQDASPEIISRARWQEIREKRTSPRFNNDSRMAYESPPHQGVRSFPKTPRPLREELNLDDSFREGMKSGLDRPRLSLENTPTRSQNIFPTHHRS